MKKHFFIIFLIAFILFSLLLGKIPSNINPDEADNLRTYLIAQYTNKIPLYGLKWDGGPYLSIALIGFSWKILGESILSLRIMAALMGSLAVSLFFLLLTFITKNKWLSTVLAFSLATTPVFMNFSRSAWDDIFNAVPVVMISIALYLLFEKNEYNPLSKFLLILSVSLGAYFSHAGILFFPAVCIILIAALIIKKQLKYFNILLLLIPVFIILYSPQLKEIYSQREFAFSRINAVSILNKKDFKQQLWKNVQNNSTGYLLFNKKNFDTNLSNRYLPINVNPISLFLVPFYLLGIFVSLKKYPYLLAFFILVLAPTQLLSTETPNMSRAIHTFPLIYLFIGVGLNTSLKKLNPYVHNLNIRKVFEFGVYLAILFIVIFNAYIYFKWITTNQTLLSREPAIKNEDYSNWLDKLKRAVKMNGFGFTVDQYKQIQRSKKTF